MYGGVGDFPWRVKLVVALLLHSKTIQILWCVHRSPQPYFLFGYVYDNIMPCEKSHKNVITVMNTTVISYEVLWMHYNPLSMSLYRLMKTRFTESVSMFSFFVVSHNFCNHADIVAKTRDHELFMGHWHWFRALLHWWIRYTYFKVLKKLFPIHLFPLWIIDPKGHTIPEGDLKLDELQTATGVVSKLHLFTAKILTSKRHMIA